MTLQNGETVGAADWLFLITNYADKRGRYCFRMDEILDPETVSSVSRPSERRSPSNDGTIRRIYVKKGPLHQSRGPFFLFSPQGVLHFLHIRADVLRRILAVLRQQP